MRAQRLRTLERLAGSLAVLALCGTSTPGPAGASELHDPWDRLVSTYVDAEGRVAYRDLAARDGDTLRAYLDALAAADPTAMDPPARLAFWLNAYNAAAVRGVLEGYDAEGFFARQQFFSWYEFTIAGEERTLEALEHDILRTRFAEPRIHFALVCASSSCPKLRREAYRGTTVDRQLNAQTRAFLDDPTRNRLDDPQVLRLSPIFKWFREDFQRHAGGVLPFLRRYVSVQGTPRLEYLEYDWTLNAQPGQRPQ